MIVNKIISKAKKAYRLRRITQDYNRMAAMLRNESFNSVNNRSPRSIKSVLFVVPGISAHAGGHTSILRLGTSLVDYGLEVAYITYNNQSKEDLENNARVNLSECKGTFLTKDDKLSHEYDVVIATLWESVYYAKQYSGYKMYFVQDYEPYFYAIGEKYFLAKRTYELGFHMVSLGPWNKKEIQKHSTSNNLKIDVIDFPFEPKEYTKCSRNYFKYSDLKRITIVAYIKQEDKRMPTLSQVILYQVKKRFKEIGVEVDLLYYGMDKKIPVKGGTNLGKLAKKELNDLYHKADFGFVASMTNISLVPYEMIATGLPVIEMSEGSFSAFFGEGSAILCDFDPEKLFNEIKDYCEHPDKIIAMQRKAEEYVSQFSWDQTSRQFIKIVSGITNE